MQNSNADFKTPLTTPKVIPTNERPEFKWIVLGSSLLSFCAGFVNVVSILSTFSYTVSHNTGVTSKFAIFLARLELPSAGFNMSVLVAYVMGSMLVGAFIKRDTFHYSRVYGFFLLLESALLMLTCHLYIEKDKLGIVVASFAMGLQNALFTNFSGAVVRTTHVTGLLTDIGIHFGHLIRKCEKTKEFWRVYVLLPLLTGFILGGVVATWCYEIFDLYAFYIPALILGTAGSIWTVWRLVYQKSLSNKEFANAYKN
jgi:uncharacterized membrane protein YoaK (UPF0700 family)